MENRPLTRKEVITLVNGILLPALKQMQSQMNYYKKFVKFDSVKDVHSPITGASQQIGFFNTPKIAKPTVTGSKGANAALTSLCTALANLGLITNSTT
jgi:hypothetical protein